MQALVASLKPAHVACLRHIGYDSTIRDTWEELRNWAKQRGIDPDSVLRFGVSLDNPMQIPIDKCRYDACIQIPADMKIDGGPFPADLPGGRYVMLPFRGASRDVGAGFQQLFHAIPAMNLQFDTSRPPLEQYAGDAEDDGETFSCMLCVAVR